MSTFEVFNIGGFLMFFNMFYRPSFWDDDEFGPYCSTGLKASTSEMLLRLANPEVCISCLFQHLPLILSYFGYCHCHGFCYDTEDSEA